MPTTIEPRRPMLRVLELGGPAAGYCGRLFVELGAEVTRVRQAAPEASTSTGALDLFLHTGKSIRAIAPHRLAGVAAGYDIVVTDVPVATLDALDFERWETPVRVSVTPFGRHGPCRDWRATGAVAQALGGYTALMGDPQRAPLGLPGHYAEYQSGQYAYIAALALHTAIAQGRLGPGHDVDVSMVETVASLSQFTLVMWTFEGKLRSRHGNDWENLYPISLFRCADGWVVFNVVPNFWVPFTKLLGRPDLATDPRFGTNDARMVNRAALRRIIEETVGSRTRAELLTLGQRECRVPTGVVLTLEEVLDDPHLEARGFWSTAARPDGRRVRVPPAPFRYAEERPVPPSAGRLGATVRANAARPLAGVRIADFTHVWAGPLATRILADLGADVVKIEAPLARGPADLGRTTAGIHPRGVLGEEPWNRQGIFNKLNRNKRSLAVDLKAAEGRAVVQDLVRTSDVIIDNFSARAMGRMGLGFAEVHTLNPSAIQIGMSGFGASGPYRDFVAYGPSVEPMSGLTALMGYSDDEPRLSSIALPDAVAGVTAAAATVTALYRRWAESITGLVECSLHEGMVALLGEFLVQRQLAGTEPRRAGNAQSDCVPAGVYPCLPTTGLDEWIAIVCVRDAEFRSLAACVGFEGARWATRAARLADRDALDRLVAERTRVHEKSALMRALQRAGVAAGAVYRAPDLLADEQLAARGFFVALGGAHIEPLPYPGLPLHIDGAGLGAARAAPRFGEHNAAIARALGRSDAEFEALARDHVLLSRPPRHNV
jgi:crotonobetainyl-CoA:carnitine CoA-transferase CaiB-like acyl-CoA transferase